MELKDAWVTVKVKMESGSSRRVNSLDKLLDALRKARKTVGQAVKSNAGSIIVTCSPIPVYIPLGRNVVVTVEMLGGEQYIVLRADGKCGRILRIDNKLGVGANWSPGSKYPISASLIANLFSYGDAFGYKYTDRGCFRVYSGSPAHVSLELRDWLNSEVTPEELVGFVELAEARAKEIIDKILASSFSA